MALLNHETREVVFKVVYCGPGLSGKTTNLNYVYSCIDTDQRGDLVSLSTSTDRTIFFDFLPINAVILNGYSTKFQLYTVPGQVMYNATRQLVLRGVDGIVFVADSQNEMLEENVRSFHNMEQNVAWNHGALDCIPMVLQYNKRDLPNAAPVQHLEYLLNRRAQRVTSYEAVASQGYNVFATLNAVSQLVLHRFYQVVGTGEAEEASRASPSSPVAQARAATPAFTGA